MFINLLKWLNSVDGTANRLTEVLVNVNPQNRNRMTPIKGRNRVKYQFTRLLLLIHVILFQPRISQVGFALWPASLSLRRPRRPYQLPQILLDNKYLGH